MAVGSGRLGCRLGDRVAWPQFGSAAPTRYTCSRRGKLVPGPRGVDLDVAAAVMLQGLTAHYLTTSTYAVGPGEVALVHAAAGGVGQLLVQLVTPGEAPSSRRPAATRSARRRATSAPSTSSTTGPSTTSRRRCGRPPTGGASTSPTTASARTPSTRRSPRSGPRGMLALFGAASGQVPPFDLQRLNAAGSLFVTRPKLLDHLATRAELEWRAGEVLGAVADGSLRVAVGGRYPLSEAATAYADLEGRRTQGKLLLIP